VARATTRLVNTTQLPVTAALLPAITAQTAVRSFAPPAPIAPVRQLPTGRIWQCVVNGQKTFSDSPCGADASVHQLSAVNRMEATPIRRTPVYAAYSPYPVDPPMYAFDSSDQDAPDTYAGSSSSQIIVFNERERAAHRPQAHHPEHRPGRLHD
jgi:hypothetical protein